MEKKIISYTKLSDSEFEVYYYNEKDKHTGEGDQWDNVHSKITGKVIIKMVEDNYDVQIVQYDKTVDFDDEKESDQKISLSDLDENGKKQVLVDIFGYSDRKSLFEEQTRVFITDGRAKFSFVDEEKVEISHLYSEYPNEFTCSIDKGKKTIQVNNLSSSTKPDEFTYSSNGKEIYYKNIIEDKSTPIDSVNYIKYNVTTYKLK